MIQYNPNSYLPLEAELIESDETPVDNELQNLVPNLLLTILALIWANRENWFFGVDMGIFYAENQPPIVPDGFLSLGVPRFTGEQGRLSYILRQENKVVPILVLEVVSKTYRDEYQQKKIDYAELGVLYYVIYNPSGYHSSQGDTFEVHRLVNGVYEKLSGEPVWMPEIGLGIGREIGTFEGWKREWLYWYDKQGNRFSTSNELLENLLIKLREKGIDPDSL
jgi:Uma2 family endonuclease